MAIYIYDFISLKHGFKASCQIILSYFKAGGVCWECRCPGNLQDKVTSAKAMAAATFLQGGLRKSPVKKLTPTIKPVRTFGFKTETWYFDVF